MTCLTQYAFFILVSRQVYGGGSVPIYIFRNMFLKMFATDPKAVGLADLSGWSPVPWDQHIRLASRRGLSITRACLKTGRGRPAGRGVWCSFGSECQILGRPGQWFVDRPVRTTLWHFQFTVYSYLWSFRSDIWVSVKKKMSFLSDSKRRHPFCPLKKHPV